MAKKNNKISSRTWQEGVVWASSFFVVSTSRRWMRNIVVVFLLVVFIWLTYSRVYSPLKQDVPLPVSVDQKNPGLDLEVLQAINTQRAERMQRQKPNYFNFSRVFVAPRKNE